ncbi:Protein crossbronx [Sergentomyia squamirostris]
MTLDAKIQQEYKILAEYKMILSENVRGVYVIPSHDNSLHWYGVIFVRNGVYREGIFRFSITLPDTFPADRKTPVITFTSEVYHPFICPENKELDTRDAFPEWNTSCHVWQLLKYLIYILEQPDICLSSPLNDQEESKKCRNVEALQLLEGNRDDFLAKIKVCIQESQEKVYESPSGDDDKHAIIFERWNPAIHDAILEKIKNNTPLDEIHQDDRSANTGIFP